MKQQPGWGEVTFLDPSRLGERSSVEPTKGKGNWFCPAEEEGASVKGASHGEHNALLSSRW